MKRLFLSTLTSLSTLPCLAHEGYYSRLENDTLYIGNDLIERRFLWNNGNLITHSLSDKSSGHVWFNQLRSPDMNISAKKD